MRKMIRRKTIAIVSVICTMFVTQFISISADESNYMIEEEIEVSSSQTDSEIVLTNGIEPQGEYYTFLEFTPGTHTNIQSYNFTVGHACNFKMMWIGQYVDGSSGNLLVVLQGPNTYQEYYLPMDKVARTISFKPNASTNLLPAGNYSIMLWPNDVSREYVSVGKVYSLDY